MYPTYAYVASKIPAPSSRIQHYDVAYVFSIPVRSMLSRSVSCFLLSPWPANSTLRNFPRSRHARTHEGGNGSGEIGKMHRFDSYAIDK